MAPNTKKMQVKRYATRALIPSELGILEVTLLKELISTRKSPTRRFNLRYFTLKNIVMSHDDRNIPARNKVRRNEEADPGYEDEEGRGDVIVEDELETPSLNLNPEATDRVVTNVPPGEDIIHGMERDHLHILQ